MNQARPARVEDNAPDTLATRPVDPDHDLDLSTFAEEPDGDEVDAVRRTEEGTA